MYSWPLAGLSHWDGGDKRGDDDVWGERSVEERREATWFKRERRFSMIFDDVQSKGGWDDIDIINQILRKDSNQPNRLIETKSIQNSTAVLGLCNLWYKRLK